MITTIEPTIELDCNGQEERDTFYEKKRWDIYSYMYNDLTRMNLREKFAVLHFVIAGLDEAKLACSTVYITQ